MSHPSLYHQDIISVEQFTADQVAEIIATTRKMKRLVEKKGATDILKGRMMTALFYEPSSRTFGSFITAMQRLGGGFIPIQGVTYSSVSKGETLVDTVRTFASYSDVIVLRHPEVGSAKIAAEFCEKPIINAGDGVGEHPTQALLDLFTIVMRFGSAEKLTITMVGDMRNGRTVHSLAKLFMLYRQVRINFVSPEILRCPPEIIRRLKEKKIEVSEQESLASLLPTTDVLYVTRVQKERFSDLGSYERLKNRYVITPTLLKSFKKSGIIMHPFPRVGEITMDVDLDPRAAYITDQMRNGMYVRMALLSLVLEKMIY